MGQKSTIHIYEAHEGVTTLRGLREGAGDHRKALSQVLAAAAHCQELVAWGADSIGAEVDLVSLSTHTAERRGGGEG